MTPWFSLPIDTKIALRHMTKPLMRVCKIANHRWQGDRCAAYFRALVQYDQRLHSTHVMRVDTGAVMPRALNSVKLRPGELAVRHLYLNFGWRQITEVSIYLTSAFVPADRMPDVEVARDAYMQQDDARGDQLLQKAVPHAWGLVQALLRKERRMLLKIDDDEEGPS